jgi:hypothetical protein
VDADGEFEVRFNAGKRSCKSRMNYGRRKRSVGLNAVKGEAVESLARVNLNSFGLLHQEPHLINWWGRAFPRRRHKQGRLLNGIGQFPALQLPGILP